MFSRETVGIGLALALVSQLPLAMTGRLDVVARNPGTALYLSFHAGPVSPSPWRRDRVAVRRESQAELSRF